MIKNSILVVLTAATLTFAGCSKEKKYIKKIEGEWDVTNFTINDVNVLTANVDNGVTTVMEMDYDDDGDFNITANLSYGLYNYTYIFPGTWEITDTNLALDYNGTEQTGVASAFMYLAGVEEYEYLANEAYEIVELTKSKLILEGTNQGQSVRIEADAK